MACRLIASFVVDGRERILQLLAFSSVAAQGAFRHLEILMIRWTIFTCFKFFRLCSTACYVKRRYMMISIKQHAA